MNVLKSQQRKLKRMQHVKNTQRKKICITTVVQKLPIEQGESAYWFRVKHSVKWFILTDCVVPEENLSKLHQVSKNGHCSG